MCTLIKLTHFGSGRPTLINMDNVSNIYRVNDKPSGRLGTKITYSHDNTFIIVAETMQEVLQEVQNFKIGEFQTCDWVEETASLEDRLHDSYDNMMNDGYDRRRTANSYDNYGGRRNNHYQRDRY